MGSGCYETCRKAEEGGGCLQEWGFAFCDLVIRCWYESATERGLEITFVACGVAFLVIYFRLFVKL